MTQITMPHLGESVGEGTIGRWLKRPGEQVNLDEPLVEVTTDKVNTEMPSPIAGVLSEITAQEGETVKVGAPIAVIAAAGEAVADSAAPVTNQEGGEGAGAGASGGNTRGSNARAGSAPARPGMRRDGWRHRESRRSRAWWTSPANGDGSRRW